MKTETHKKSTMQPLLSKLTMTVGILLMIFTIYVDSEPGAIPLLLIMAGAIWYFVIFIQLRTQNKME